MVEGLSTERSPLLNVETEPRMWKGAHSLNVLSAVRSLLLNVETEPRMWKGAHSLNVLSAVRSLLLNVETEPKFSVYPVSLLCVDSFTFPDIYQSGYKCKESVLV